MSDACPSLLEHERRVPVTETVDVLVAGGGPAGIAAAVAAAREGAKTLLVERYGYLGGMITGSHVTWVIGVGDGSKPVARGITQDIRDRLEPLGAVTYSKPVGDYMVDAEVFKWQAVEMLEEAGASLLLHTLVCDPIVTDGRVEGVFTESKSGRRAIRAAVVVDCTADADLAFRAGCGCDNETHDVTLKIVVDGADGEKVAAFEKADPGRHREIMDKAKELNGGVPVTRGRLVKGVDGTDAEALTRAEVELRRDCFRALHFLRENMPGWEKARIKETLPQIGVRQSRRIHGEYTLTDADLRASRHFQDGVGRLGAYLDGYKPYDPAGLDYDIPYRCLVPRDVDGLLVAGRCVSCDYAACNTLRLIVPCFVTGQAAGAAAALAVERGVAPRDLSITDLRNALTRQGVHLGEEASPANPAPPPIASA